jgi:hypothetical protein
MAFKVVIVQKGGGEIESVYLVPAATVRLDEVKELQQLAIAANRKATVYVPGFISGNQPLAVETGLDKLVIEVHTSVLPQPGLVELEDHLSASSPEGTHSVDTLVELTDELPHSEV